MRARSWLIIALGVTVAVALSGPRATAQPTRSGVRGPIPQIAGPEVRSKSVRGSLAHETGAWLLSSSRPAGNDLSRQLPNSRASLPVHLPDSGN